MAIRTCSPTRRSKPAAHAFVVGIPGENESARKQFRSPTAKRPYSVGKEQTMKAIRFDHAGGPEVLKLEDIELPPPGPGQVRVKHTVIGVNFIDTYQRSGLYPVPLPSGLGLEAAGVVEGIGENVS